MTTPAQPKPSRRRFRWLRRLIVLATLVLVLYLARGWILSRAGRFLDIGEPPRRTDYVLILGGESSTRPFVAAALLRAGLARRALVPTVKMSPEAADGLWPAEHVLIRRILLARGIRADDILVLPGECDSTIDEAHALARFLDSEPEATVTVVTNDFHTRRARMLFRRVLKKTRENRVFFVAAPLDGVKTENWWRSERGFVVYINEYLKLIRYSLW
jgi:uncharacterized SAM-binding protein YcdF (DUF218 family)